MAFLDNTGLERLWQHICAKFANREDLEIVREGNILDNSNFLTPIRQREDFRRSGSIIITVGGTSGSASGGGTTNTTQTLSYLIDRWRTSSAVTHELKTGFIFPAGTHYLRQGLELGTFKNMEYTVVLTFSNNEKVGGVVDLTTADSGSYSNGIVNFVLVKNYNNTYDKIDITINNSGSSNLIVKNVAVYPGAYSTLPTYVNKPKAEERERALQFFKKYSGSQLAGRCTSGSMIGKLYFEIPFRTTNYELLIKKNANGLEEGGTIYCNNKTPAGVAVKGLTINSAGIDTVLLTIKTANEALTTNESGVWVGGTVGFDADYN